MSFLANINPSGAGRCCCVLMLGHITVELRAPDIFSGDHKFSQSILRGTPKSTEHIKLGVNVSDSLYIFQCPGVDRVTLTPRAMCGCCEASGGFYRD